MSLESLTIALHHSRAAGTAKLVLIGIANHDGDGGAWPSVDTLARYAGVSRRNVQNALQKLEQLGEIRRIKGAGGDHSTADHMRPNLYLFLLQCPHDCDRTKNHRTARSRSSVELSTGVSLPTPPVASITPGGVGSDTRTVPLTQPRLKEAHSSNRARGACGHDLVDDRHCIYGCAHAVREEVLA